MSRRRQDMSNNHVRKRHFGKLKRIKKGVAFNERQRKRDAKAADDESGDSR